MAESDGAHEMSGSERLRDRPDLGRRLFRSLPWAGRRGRAIRHIIRCRDFVIDLIDIPVGLADYYLDMFFFGPDRGGFPS
jgi:hypothetical protein